MIYDNLAGLFDHHENMFLMNKKESPHWNIVQMATFVLDIADEEFRQGKEYDKNALKPDSLDPFTQKRLENTLEKKYPNDSGITLRADFKEKFLKWVGDNLQDFQEAGFGRHPLKIFNELCVSAKTGQALRLYQE